MALIVIPRQFTTCLSGDKGNNSGLQTKLQGKSGDKIVAHNHTVEQQILLDFIEQQIPKKQGTHMHSENHKITTDWNQRGFTWWSKTRLWLENGEHGSTNHSLYFD